MNQIYLDEKKRLFINGNEVKGVLSISTKTTPLGTKIIIELKGDYKSDYIFQQKEHPLNECSTE